MSAIEFPEMRHEVIAALRSLSDRTHQQLRWGRREEGVNYYDDLTLNLHILYDDCQVLPSPESAVPAVLHAREVTALRALDAALSPLIGDLGDRPDSDYQTDPRWPGIIEAARSALKVMEESEQ